MKGREPKIGSQAQVSADEALLAFLKSGYDEARVTDLDQELQVRLSKKDLYIPAYTRNRMDKNHGKPVMALYTKTDVPNGLVYLIPADNPGAKEARKVRISDTMGGAHVAFAVPLRKLGLTLPDRKYTFTLTTKVLPGMGTVYVMSFEDFDHEKLGVDGEVAAVTQQVKQEQAEAKRAQRIQRIKSKSPKTQAE